MRRLLVQAAELAGAADHHQRPTPRLLVPQGYKQRVKGQFDRRSAVYDEHLDFHLPLARALVDAAHLRPGESVLDAASGTGVVALLAAECVGPSGQVTGVDISCAMLEKVR
jgi:ubiquinone/menaquinone biosynthesis C-methylase UbiE